MLLNTKKDGIELFSAVIFSSSLFVPLFEQLVKTHLLWPFTFLMNTTKKPVTKPPIIKDKVK